MLAILQGFGIVVIVMAVGFLLLHLRVVGPEAQKTLATIVYAVATPALLIDQLITTDPRDVLGPNFPVIAASAIIVGLAAYAVLRLRRWDNPSSMIGMLAGSYANGGNLGIPLAAYVLGDATAVVPVILFQVAFYAPVMLTLLDISTTTDPQAGWGQNLLVALKNPMLIAAVIGLTIALVGLPVPDLISGPISILAGASVPLALIVFGMSLYGAKIRFTRGVAVAVAAKNFLHPVVAGLLAWAVFGMTGQALYTAVVLGALPTAQNVLTYALRFRSGAELARDAGVASTVLSLPTLVVVGALLGAPA